jgi:hypothetical protein
MEESKVQNEASRGEPQESGTEENRRRAERQRYLKIERYRYRTLWMIMLGCSGAFLSGLWLADVDMETLFERQEKYMPAESICLRTAWIKAVDGEKLMQVCKEWINNSDRSSRIHRMSGAKLVKQPDGSYRVQYEERINYKLLSMIGFVVLITVIGHRLHRYLIETYRTKLDDT